VWRAEQISIHAGPNTDRDAFISKVLRSQLGYVSAAIRGQAVVIHAHRVAKLQLSLSEGLVDFAKPVVIHCNDVKRFEGRISPSVDVLLQSLTDTWDFVHPSVAVLTFNVQTDADPGE
jgi:hypothetical protein